MGLGINCFNKTVASAGTRVQLSANALYAQAIYLESIDSNTGSLYVGNSTVSATNYMKKLAAGGGFSLNAAPGAFIGPDGGMLELSQLWVDSSTASQVLLVTYILHIGRY